MRCRLAFAVLVAFVSIVRLDAQGVVTHPFPGITYISRTDSLPSFRCPGCPAPTPNPRLARLNIVLVDLNAPEIRFKLTPEGTSLPEPNFPTPGWPLPPPPFEVVRQRTLQFLETSHAQVAINSHFFAPFPVPAGSTQGAYAYLIGLAASRGNVYSAFEAPFQNYALVTDSPAVNIDASNNATIVHRDPAFDDGKHVLEEVQLWNALSGSAQIVTNGVKTIPDYKDATYPDELLTPNETYTRGGRHWYFLSNARTAIGLTQDNRTLVLFTVDGTNGGHGMQVGEAADVLIRDYGVYNALNLDGGGSTTLAMQDPATLARRVVNSPSDNPPRAEASSLAVYSDGIAPVTTASVSPAPNANGWNNTGVTVTLASTDLASGFAENPPGWVDELRYALTGAQPGDQQTVAGATTSFGVSAIGTTAVNYFATDAAGNDEAGKSLAVRIDSTPPDVNGLPGADCSLWPPNHQMRQVAAVTADDLTAGVASLNVTVTSNEQSNPNQVDAVVSPNGSGGFMVSLGAERKEKGAGRIYTITATAVDKADNVRTTTATCRVPHDQRMR